MDPLTGTYRLPCPRRGEGRVRLSAFREIERLPGAAHPAVYRVVFGCSCGDDHVALIGHDLLDRAPLGLDEEMAYVNLMTSRRDDLVTELAALASARIGRGEWPWSFYCYLEDTPRAVTPSSFRLLEQAPRALAVAVSCPACATTTINLVSSSHVDVPFHSDRRVGVVTEVFREDAIPTIEAFRAQLGSAEVDERRLERHG